MGIGFFYRTSQPRQRVAVAADNKLASKMQADASLIPNHKRACPLVN